MTHKNYTIKSVLGTIRFINHTTGETRAVKMIYDHRWAYKLQKTQIRSLYDAQRFVQQIESWATYACCWVDALCKFYVG